MAEQSVEDDIQGPEEADLNVRPSALLLDVIDGVKNHFVKPFVWGVAGTPLV